MEYSPDRSVLPIEVLYDILTMCIAESIHLNCVSPTISSWDAYYISILSSVSFLFREIVTDVVMQSFLVPGPVNGQSVFPLIQNMLDYMREFGCNASRTTARASRFIPSPNNFNNIPLVQTYIMYVSAASLRVRNIWVPRQYEETKSSIQNTLSSALGVCETVRLKALVSLLRSIWEDDLALNHYAHSIVEQCHRLNKLLYDGEDLGAEDPPVKRDINAIMISMPEALLKAEACVFECDTIFIRSPYKFIPLRASCRLPGVERVITKISLRSDMDAHNIHKPHWRLHHFMCFLMVKDVTERSMS